MNNRKIELPNYTQTPNVLFDELFKEMGEAELRITLAICRKTFGYHKNNDIISLSQLENMTGLSRQGVLNGIEAGVIRGTLARKKFGNSYSYEIKIVNEVDQDNEDSQRSRLSLVNEVDQASQRSRPEMVNEVDTQKKEINIKENVKESCTATNNSEINIFKLYENATGTLPGSMVDTLMDAESEYPLEWIKDAISEAVEYNARSWKYMEAILKRWKATGRKDDRKTNGNNRKKKHIDMEMEKLLEEGRKI